VLHNHGHKIALESFPTHVIILVIDTSITTAVDVRLALELVDTILFMIPLTVDTPLQQDQLLHQLLLLLLHLHQLLLPVHVLPVEGVLVLGALTSREMVI
jgi:hypothetical protein